ncbi:MAG: arsenic resistance protein [Cyanobacteriota bacterium]
MTWLDKAQPFLILLSMGMGLALAQIPWIRELAPSVIVPLLALMLYTTFLLLPLKNFGQNLQKLKVILASLAINFIWTPIFAWILGALFLRDAPDLWVGLIMLMVTPCTDWYIVFTGVAGGDVILATALLPVNLTLQVLLLPIYLLIFAGTLVDIKLSHLLESVFLVLLMPLLMALVSRSFLLWKKGWNWIEKISPKISVIQILSLDLAIVSIFASEGNALVQNPRLLFRIFIPVFLFFLVNFIVASQVRYYLKFSYEEFTCLTCTTLARNSPLSLAIAASAFPHQSLITLTLVIGPLIELPIMVFISQFLLKVRQQGYWQT